MPMTPPVAQTCSRAQLLPSLRHDQPPIPTDCPVRGARADRVSGGSLCYLSRGPPWQAGCNHVSHLCIDRYGLENGYVCRLAYRHGLRPLFCQGQGFRCPIVPTTRPLRYPALFLPYTVGHARWSRWYLQAAPWSDHSAHPGTSLPRTPRRLRSHCEPCPTPPSHHGPEPMWTGPEQMWPRPCRARPSQTCALAAARAHVPRVCRRRWWSVGHRAGARLGR